MLPTPKMSVIMPVYNAESTIGTAIESIVKQSIGIQNIQIILINDGSTDGSGDLCKQYQQAHPDSIDYLEKPNGGVSSARNAGLDQVRGKYIAFLDSDDAWNAHAFEHALNFFDAHYDEFDLLECRLLFQKDGIKSTHPLDFKFDKGTRVANLATDFRCIQSTAGNAILKAEAVQHKRFDERMEIGEDHYFMMSLALQKNTVGILKEAVYYYNRTSENSLSSTQHGSTYWVTQLPSDLDLRLINLSLERYGKVVPVIQYSTMYELRWRLGKQGLPGITEKEKQVYRETIAHILSYIDDSFINLDDSLYFRQQRLYYLRLKYGTSFRNALNDNSRGWLCVNKMPVFNYTSKGSCNIESVEMRDGMLRIQGTTFLRAAGNLLHMCVRLADGTEEVLALSPYPVKNLYGITGDLVRPGMKFSLELPLKEHASCAFYVYSDLCEKRLPVHIDAKNLLPCTLSSEQNGNTKQPATYLVGINNKNSIVVRKSSLVNCAKVKLGQLKQQTRTVLAAQKRKLKQS